MSGSTRPTVVQASLSQRLVLPKIKGLKVPAGHISPFRIAYYSQYLPRITRCVRFNKTYSSTSHTSSTCCTVYLSILSHQRIESPGRTGLRCVGPYRTVVTFWAGLTGFLSCGKGSINNYNKLLGEFRKI